MMADLCERDLCTFNLGHFLNGVKADAKTCMTQGPTASPNYRNSVSVYPDMPNKHNPNSLAFILVSFWHLLPPHPGIELTPLPQCPSAWIPTSQIQLAVGKRLANVA
jgi:hypothetical protein